jgi:hypothetical protein
MKIARALGLTVPETFLSEQNRPPAPQQGYIQAISFRPLR